MQVFFSAFEGVAVKLKDSGRFGVVRSIQGASCTVALGTEDSEKGVVLPEQPETTTAVRQRSMRLLVTATSSLLNTACTRQSKVSWVTACMPEYRKLSHPFLSGAAQELAVEGEQQVCMARRHWLFKATFKCLPRPSQDLCGSRLAGSRLELAIARNEVPFVAG